MVNLSQIFSSPLYYLNPYSIPPTIVASLVLILGFFALSLGKKSNFNRSLLYLCISSAIWLYGNALVFNSKLDSVALFWARIMYIGFILAPATIFHISVTYTNRYIEERPFVLIAYAVSALFIVFTWHSHFFYGVREYFWGFYPDSGILQTVFLVFMSFYPALGLLNLITFYRRSLDVLERKRTKHLMIAFTFTSFSYTDILASYGIEIYPFGYLAILCFVLSITYSIIKYHNLMVQQHAEELEKKVEEKTSEISHVLGELRTTQLKLFETGKISALASLSAGILHQISQPITAIHGFVKFIKKEMKETDPFYKAILLMEEQSVYLKDMLEDLMELIRHREIKKENINVNVCLKRALNLLTDELRIRRVDWEVTLDDGLPEVYADNVHLQQIFMNILVNAMEALSVLPKGSRRHITITSNFDRASQRVIISFADTGPGIDPEAQQQVFEPFFSTKTKGSGIGLALCKDLIAEHGGEIDIESKPNNGTIFVVKFPSVAALAQSNLRVQKI